MQYYIAELTVEKGRLGQSFKCIPELSNATTLAGESSKKRHLSSSGRFLGQFFLGYLNAGAPPRHCHSAHITGTQRGVAIINQAQASLRDERRGRVQIVSEKCLKRLQDMEIKYCISRLCSYDIESRQMGGGLIPPNAQLNELVINGAVDKYYDTAHIIFVSTTDPDVIAGEVDGLGHKLNFDEVKFFKLSSTDDGIEVFSSTALASRAIRMAVETKVEPVFLSTMEYMGILSALNIG